jgi:hypothetical protein
MTPEIQNELPQTSDPALASCGGSVSVERQYHLQGGRCFWCQCFTLPENLTREHLYPRRNKQRETRGGAWVLAHEVCNKARGALNIGSPRFSKWLRRVMRGDVRRFERRDKWQGNPS